MLSLPNRTPGVRNFGIGLGLLGTLLLVTGLRGSPGDEFLMGLLLLPAAILLVFGWGEVILDRDHGRIIRRAGLWRLYRKQVHPLEDFQEVAIRVERRQTSKGVRLSYRVLLEGRSRLEIAERWNELEARALGERIVRHLALRLRDLSSGSPVVREASDLDLSLAERLLQKGGIPEIPSLPKGAPIRLAETVDEQRFEYGPTGIRSWEWGAALGALALGAVFLWLQSKPHFLALARLPSSHPDFLRHALVCAALALGTLLIVAAPLLWSAFGIERIRASKEGLRIERRLGILRWSRQVAQREIEELHAKDHELRVRGDRLDVAFGRGLTARDRKWLARALEAALAQRYQTEA